jgi:hypothetical protein
MGGELRIEALSFGGVLVKLFSSAPYTIENHLGGELLEGCKQQHFVGLNLKEPTAHKKGSIRIFDGFTAWVVPCGVWRKKQQKKN